MELKEASFFLRKYGGRAMSAFCRKCLGAHRLPLRKPYDIPAALWIVSKVIHYVLFTEFALPDPDNAPLIFQIRVNKHGPQSLYDYYESYSTDAVIAESPTLTIHALPKEIEDLGGWLMEWHYCMRKQTPRPPKPPVKLFTTTVVNHNGEIISVDDFAKLGDDWRDITDLWTQPAINLYVPWIKALAQRKSC